MNIIEYFALTIAIIGVTIGLLTYVGAAVGVTKLIRAGEYGLRFSGAVLATGVYVLARLVALYVKLTWKAWRDEAGIAYHSIKDLLGMGLHGGGRGSIIATVFIELLFLMFSFVIIVGIVVTTLFSMCMAPTFILIGAIWGSFKAMVGRSCK